VQALDESGLADNTLIAFSSDNGPETLAYERAKTTGHFSMGPLRGVKRDLYEGGHRVPLVMGWPGVIRPGTRSDALVGLVDWFATVAAIVGQRPPDTSGLDSMNLLPLLRGEVKQVRSHLLIDSCVSGIARGLRIDSWVYLDHESGELNSGRNQEPPWFRELHGVVDAPGAELYDLASDLGQGKNRIAAEPERASRMKDAFDRLWGDAARSTPPFTTQLGKPEKAGRP
jgi:arylsulfatase A